MNCVTRVSVIKWIRVHLIPSLCLLLQQGCNTVNKLKTNIKTNFDYIKNFVILHAGMLLYYFKDNFSIRVNFRERGIMGFFKTQKKPFLKILKWIYFQNAEQA